MNDPSKHKRIPSSAEWSDYETDLDVKHLHELFFGKSNAEVEKLFADGRAIERSNELLFAPRAVFQYYIHAFVGYLMSDAARGDADAASPFLNLLVAREERDPGSVAAIHSSLAGCIEFISKNQAYFDADMDIYGDFQARVSLIRQLCGVGNG